MSTSAGPIVIGGLSFSGKTPIRMILGAHPALSMTRHTRMWDHYWGRFGDLRAVPALDRCLAAMAQDEGVRALQPDLGRVRREFLAGPPTYGALFALVHGQAAERVGKRRWGDQLKCVERFADPIFAELPDARMLHVLREPRDRVAAMCASRTRRIGRLGWETAHGEASARTAVRNERRHRGRYLVVRYEDFRVDPADTITAICGFIGEDVVDPVRDAIEQCRQRPPVGTPGRTGSRLGLADHLAYAAWSVVGVRGATRIGAT